jgi:hypothetical protein
VNLTLTDLRALPLASALVGGDGEVIACTPEWRGDGIGSASYPVRNKRLVVCVEPAAPACAALLDRLLRELDAAAVAATPPRSLQVQMLAASLRLVAGRSASGAMRSEDVLRLACAGIQARTGLRINVDDAGNRTLEARASFTVRGGEAAALVLVQLAVNAERHGDADAVTLATIVGGLSVAWRGAPAGRVSTARRREHRDGWGLGFARIAADAIGGVVHPPRPRDGRDGWMVSVLEVGVPRLSLPLAAVRDQRVLRATRAWDDETGAIPGTPITVSRQLLRAASDAATKSGAIARADGVAARMTNDLLWFAVPPDDAADQARDVVDGLTHEQALIDGVAEPQRSRINALARLLGHVLGTPLQRVPGDAWTRRMRMLADAFGMRMPVPEVNAAEVIDPAVSALVASEAGERFEVEADAVWLRLRAGSYNNALITQLVTGEPRRIRLG